MPWAEREKPAEDDTNEWYDVRYPLARTKMNLRGRRGWPDQCYWLPLRPLLIEFKAPGEEPRSLQSHIHKTLRELGYEVQVHTSAAEAISAIEQAIQVRRRQLELLGGTAAVASGALPGGGGQVPGRARRGRTVP